MIKRIVSVVLILSMVVVISACGNETAQNGKLNIVCTNFAAYDWTRAIIGDNPGGFEISILGDGVDLHSFQPDAQDIVKIHTADLFVQVGGPDENWTNDLNLDGESLRLFDLLDEKEKICISADHTNHKHSADEFDGHIWLSLKLAQRMVNEICDRICELDTANGVKYQKNCAEYIERLNALDGEYQSAVDASKDKVVVFADRYPFAYLMKDYNIICISAFDGCSSDSNASFDTVAHMSEAVKEYNKETILVLENSNESVVQPLRSVLTDRVIETAVMNSCQIIDSAETASYIDIMTQNLESLKKALRR